MSGSGPARVPPFPAPGVTAWSLRQRLGITREQWSSTWGALGVAEIGIALALAAALGLVKLFVMPQGGSVSLEMLPLLFIAVRRGVVPAVVAGFLYGCLQALLPGFFFVNPIQWALDYPLAFAALGLAGLVSVPWLGGAESRASRGSVKFTTRWWSPFTLLLVAAVATGVAGRFACHFLSGVIFFGSYAPEGQPVRLYSLIYNGSYILPELVITTAALWFLLPAYDAALGPVRSHA